DLTPGPESGGPLAMTSFAGQLILSMTDDGADIELWRSDGTAAGTELLQDINTRPQTGAVPSHFFVTGDLLLFVAYGGATGRELWKLTKAAVSDTPGDDSGDPGDDPGSGPGSDDDDGGSSGGDDSGPPPPSGGSAPAPSGGGGGGAFGGLGIAAL